MQVGLIKYWWMLRVDFLNDHLHLKYFVPTTKGTSSTRIRKSLGSTHKFILKSISSCYSLSLSLSLVEKGNKVKYLCLKCSRLESKLLKSLLHQANRISWWYKLSKKLGKLWINHIVHIIMFTFLPWILFYSIIRRREDF